jgi:REP element-mobilizing transposase RayT
LPHYQPPDATYHVIFRLAGSLPVEVIERMVQEQLNNEEFLFVTRYSSKHCEAFRVYRQRYFDQFDALLDGNTNGPQWLRNRLIADAVAEAILLTFCIMPNHVHIVFSIIDGVHVGQRVSSTYSVTAILANLKWYTALKCNRLLCRQGAFWQHESYDHVIRTDEELERTIWYVLGNPVRAGLVDCWEYWHWTYCKSGLVERPEHKPRRLIDQDSLHDKSNPPLKDG